jgi:phage/plasmid-associated DNA primase
MTAYKDQKTNKIICETIDSVDDYEKICKTTKSCFEVIPYDVPVCLYGDIDCKQPYGEYVYDEKHTHTFIDYAERALRENLSVEPKFAVSISSSPDFINNKNERTMCHSIHIHITNVKMLKSHQLLFWKKINTFMNTHIDFKDWNQYVDFTSGTFFDEKVYNDVRMFRSVYSSKPKENRPLIMFKGTFKDTVVCLGDADAIVLTVEEPSVSKTKINKTLVGESNFSYTSINADKILELGKIIKMEHINKYDDWCKIVWSLRSESDNYKDVAREISKRSKTKYDDYGFETAWDNYKPGQVSLGTFYHFAKISDASAYTEILAKYQSLYISIEDLNDIYKCCEIITPTLKKTLVLCKEKWWVLNEKQLWCQIKEPAFYIITEIRKYIDYSQNKNSKQIMVTDGLEKERLIGIGKEYLKFYERINQSSYTSTCKQYLRKHLVDNLFDEKLDKNCEFMAFKNGVVNLKTGFFREGIQWDDFITETIPYNYTPPNTKKTAELRGYLKQILNNNDEHLEYFLQILGFTFLGTPHLEKSLYFMIDGTEGGKGDNGKTFYFDILTSLMPNYVYKSKGTLLEEGNTKVHKQIIMTKGKRLVWTDEFSRTKKMNAELMKELADGKTIENEVLFGTSDKICLLFKMFILSNFMIKIDPAQTAVYNRYKQCSFGSHFDRTGNLKESIPEQLKFVADPTLADTIKTKYYNEVFGLIIEYAQKYNGSIKIPEQFIGDAKTAQLQNDEYGLWFAENCVRCNDGRVSMKKLEEISHFKKDFIMEGMSRLGFKYDKELKGVGYTEIFINGKSTKKYHKGGFLGCSIIENEINENDNDFNGEHK